MAYFGAQLSKVLTAEFICHDGLGEMMKKNWFCFFFFVLCFIPFRGNSMYQVRSFVGAATCGGKLLKKNQEIKESCLLETYSLSNLFLEIEKQDYLAFSEESKGKVLTSQELEIKSGIFRYELSSPQTVLTNEAKIEIPKGKGIIKVSETLKETEVIVFEGIANVTNLIQPNKTELAAVSINQWAGIGGRFGKKIGDLLELSKEQVEIYKVILTINKEE